MPKLLHKNTQARIARQFSNLRDHCYFNVASVGPWPLDSRNIIQWYTKEWEKLDEHTPDVFDTWRATQSELASMINCRSDEIGFAYNTSYGLNIAANGIDFKRNDEILLSDIEFPANTYPWTKLKSKGVKVKFVKSKDKRLNIEAFEKAITSRTKLLSVSHVQFFNGYRNDINRLGKICKQNNIFYVVDAIQSVGNLPVDVRKAHVDMLACGAQKWLLSPLGSGFFYLDRNCKFPVKPTFSSWYGIEWHGNWENLLRHNLDPAKDINRFGLGSIPYIQILALNKAVKLINSIGTDKIFSHNQVLLERLSDYINGSDYFTSLSNFSTQHRSSIISFTSPANKKLIEYLSKNKIHVSIRENQIRVSVDFYNTEENINRFISVLETFRRKHS